MRLAVLFAATVVVAAAPPAGLAPMNEAAFTKTLAAQKGKVVLFDFWATWCEPCRAEMPLLAKLDQKLKPKGFVLVTVSADEPEDTARAVAFLAKSGIGGAAYLKQAKDDDAFIRSIDGKWSGALPAMFLYDKTGKKARSFIGETPIAEIEAAISKLQ